MADVYYHLTEGRPLKSKSDNAQQPANMRLLATVAAAKGGGEKKATFCGQLPAQLLHNDALLRLHMAAHFMVPQRNNAAAGFGALLQQLPPQQPPPPQQPLPPQQPAPQQQHQQHGLPTLVTVAASRGPPPQYPLRGRREEGRGRGSSQALLRRVRQRLTEGGTAAGRLDAASLAVMSVLAVAPGQESKDELLQELCDTHAVLPSSPPEGGHGGGGGEGWMEEEWTQLMEDLVFGSRTRDLREVREVVGKARDMGEIEALCALMPAVVAERPSRATDRDRVASLEGGYVWGDPDTEDSHVFAAAVASRGYPPAAAPGHEGQEAQERRLLLQQRLLGMLRDIDTPHVLATPYTGPVDMGCWDTVLEACHLISPKAFSHGFAPYVARTLDAAGLQQYVGALKAMGEEGHLRQAFGAMSSAPHLSGLLAMERLVADGHGDAVVKALRSLRVYPLYIAMCKLAEPAFTTPRS